MYVIGTAGHVDHGKSALVRALTGIDPDRLREEKERGLTIDLGFAWLTLPSGREVSVVDVPGHERFIKNMLAGAGGVDLALLVVAADEGVMPQTREHLAILGLLAIPAGVVVLTKCDLVEPAYADLVEAELQEELSGTPLSGAPFVRTSSVTRTGLDALLAVIDDALDRTPPKRDLGRPRLPIDRAFTMQGFGAVVTGTLVDGSLHVGQEVELQPGGRRARIRGLQRHRTRGPSLGPGTRAAVNLSGIHTSEIERGMVLALPGTIVPAFALDVRLRATALLSHPLAHDAGITFLSATAESQAKLRLLDRDELFPGDEAWAQVLLESPAAVTRGDRCILRTPNDTVAGGVIVAVNPRRHRRNHPPALAALERSLQGTPAERLSDLLLTGPLARASVSELLGLEPGDAMEVVHEALTAGSAVERGGRLFGHVWLEHSARRLASAVEAYLGAGVLRASAPREHARSAAGIEATVFDDVVAFAAEAAYLEARPGGALAPPGYHVRLTPAQQAEAGRFLAVLAAAGASPPTDNLPGPALVAYLAEQGLVVDTGAGVVFDATAYQDLARRVTRFIESHGSVSLAEVRDLLGTSRKYAQALLEHLDSRHVTRRVGDTRVLRSPVEAGG